MMMEAMLSPETLVVTTVTRRYIPEDGILPITSLHVSAPLS
jgi:hypothetical protein